LAQSGAEIVQGLRAQRIIVRSVHSPRHDPSHDSEARLNSSVQHPLCHGIPLPCLAVHALWSGDARGSARARAQRVRGQARGIGLAAGGQVGKSTTRVPTASTAWHTPWTLCTPRLSISTMSSNFNHGQRRSRTKRRKALPLTALRWVISLGRQSNRMASIY
jgi:hypothetical protein